MYCKNLGWMDTCSFAHKEGIAVRPTVQPNFVQVRKDDCIVLCPQVVCCNGHRSKELNSSIEFKSVVLGYNPRIDAYLRHRNRIDNEYVNVWGFNGNVVFRRPEEF